MQYDIRAADTSVSEQAQTHKVNFLQCPPALSSTAPSSCNAMPRTPPYVTLPSAAMICGPGLCAAMLQTACVPCTTSISPLASPRARAFDFGRKAALCTFCTSYAPNEMPVAVQAGPLPPAGAADWCHSLQCFLPQVAKVKRNGVLMCEFHVTPNTCRSTHCILCWHMLCLGLQITKERYQVMG